MNRLEIADILIEEILAKEPTDPSDQVWPHIAVREVVENIDSDDLRRGISIGRHNMLGVVWRDI